MSHINGNDGFEQEFKQIYHVNLETPKARETYVNNLLQARPDRRDTILALINDRPKTQEEIAVHAE